jgi:hypothetical protein
LKISLPGGKTLFLGPARHGQVHPDALERPAIKKRIEAGEIEVLDEADPQVVEEQVMTRVRRSPRGHPAARNLSRKGER